MIKQAISGAQTGADIGGLMAAKRFGIPTGGWMPRGCITSAGPRPEWAKEYGVKETESAKYPQRTEWNVRDSDGTIRLAFNFTTYGELATIKAIRHHKKPFIDIDLRNPRPIQEVVDWIQRHNIQVLNIAGNSETTHQGTTGDAFEYLCSLFKALGFQDVENNPK